MNKAIVITDGIARGKLSHGLIVSGTTHQDFEMREASVGDMLDAEQDAGVHTPLNFNTQMMLRQLTRIGSFEGPFTLNMLRNMKPADFRMLRQAQQELDALGEAAPGGSATT